MMLYFFKKVYLKIFPRYPQYLKKELADCYSVLDLGCGYNSPIQYCDIPFSVGVDAFESYLQESGKKKIHNKYIKADIRQVQFKQKSFDVVICSDVLEHLTKKEGHELINKMNGWAKKKIVIMTPNGYLQQDSYDNNPLQEHKSGWSVKELKDLGFKVFGINGWKKLKGYRGKIKYNPLFLWTRVSDLTQKITYYFPSLAFQLFAVRKLKNNK